MPADLSAQTFTPSPETERPYRNALSCFSTGVTVITTMTETGPVGMTANSFASVSLDPALVLWSLAGNSNRYDAFAPAKSFAIHVLRLDQKALALEFARRGDAFDIVDWETGVTGQPILSDCLARFECNTHSVHQEGDHAIMVGAVKRAIYHDGEPLIFAQRDYGTFAPKG